MALLAESNRQAALEKNYILENSIRLKNQIDNIANYIAEQSSVLFTLKNSISRQTKLHAQLINKLGQLDPSFSSAGTGRLCRSVHVCVRVLSAYVRLMGWTFAD